MRASIFLAISLMAALISGPALAEQPPPQIQLAPPPLHPPPPAPLSPPPRYQPAPPFGLVTAIVGTTLFAVGFAMFIGSAEPWLEANCTSTPSDPGTLTCVNSGSRNTAIALDVVGGLFFAVGVVMAPIGWSQYGTWRKWRRSRPIALTPSLRASGNGAVGGLGFSF